MMAKPCRTEALRGFEIYREFLNCADQKALLADLRTVAQKAPFFTPITPWGKEMSVKMTSAGQFGWVSDRAGYRYSETHPNGQRWPDIPETLIEIWQAISNTERKPECCLINFYGQGARMGLHQDRDETDFDQPVVSLSLGDEGLFRIGNRTKGGSTQSTWLKSGDIVVMGGDARLHYHGVDRIRFGSSRLLPDNGRINVTMRVVT